MPSCHSAKGSRGADQGIAARQPVQVDERLVEGGDAVIGVEDDERLGDVGNRIVELALRQSCRRLGFLALGDVGGDAAHPPMNSPCSPKSSTGAYREPAYLAIGELSRIDEVAIRFFFVLRLDGHLSHFRLDPDAGSETAKRLPSASEAGTPPTTAS